MDRRDRRIALVGIGARLPGAHGPAGVWEMTHRREDVVTTAPPNRARHLTAHDIGDPGFDSVCRTGGFVEDWEEFDGAAFGISAREAEVMDPQQRILLETAFEAVADAGFTLDYLQRHITGVVSGYITRDYWHSVRQDPGLDAMGNVGNTGSGLSGRLSHVFGATGPSITIDTACSSGLSAVAVAVDNILLGHCSIAVATAANLVLDPRETLSFYRSGMLADDGRCKFATTTADGFVRSDGFCAVVLRPLADALAEGDRVYAVLESIAVGNDGGRSGSLPTPAVAGQVEVIRRALTLAGRSPGDVDYVEAHGTGTVVGDRVEIDGLAEVFAGRDRPLAVGSVKTRIGHCEAASGLAGLIVAALSLHYRSVPPMLAHGRLTDELRTGARGVRALVGDDLPLTDDAVIGVSSFGITGTNAHAVLSAPPAAVAAALAPMPSLPRLTSSAVAVSGPAPTVDDRVLDAALAYRVNHSAERRQVDADTVEPTAGQALIGGLWRETPTVVFAFGGFGAQWLGPAAVADPILRTNLTSTYATVRTHMPESDRHLLDGDGDIPPAIQPYATFASQLAIAGALREYGVVPDAVLGHSFGDLAAACVAGALTAEEAAGLLAARTEAVRAHARDTAMIVITGEHVRDDREWLPGVADVAVVNSRHCVVVACAAGHVDEVIGAATGRGYEARALDVVFGSHSRFVEQALAAFVPATDIGDRAAPTPFYSSTTGARSRDSSVISAQHWAANLRSRVELPPVAGQLGEVGYGVVVDIGPRAVLAGHLRGPFPGVVLATDALDDPGFLRTTLGALFAAQVPLRPKRLTPWTSELAATLTWTRAPRLVPSLRPAARPAAAAEAATAAVAYQFSGADLRTLAGHRVRGETVAPGTLTLSCLADALGREGAPVRLHDVRFLEPIALEDDTATLTLTISRERDQVRVHFTTDTDTEQALCCTATVAETTSATEAPVVTLPFDLTPIPAEEFYAAFAAAGNEWTGPFRSIAELWASDSNAHVTADLATPSGLGGTVDPALLDAALHGLAAARYGMAAGRWPQTPFFFEGVESITFHRSRLAGRARSVIAPSTVGEGYDVAVLDGDGRTVVHCEGVRIRPLAAPPALTPLHRTWVRSTRRTGRVDRHVVRLPGTPLGAAIDEAAVDHSLVEQACATVVSAVEPGHELLVDLRGGLSAPAGSQADRLASLGVVLACLARTAAEAGVPLGLVTDDIERPGSEDAAAVDPTIHEFPSAVASFVFSLAGALPYEFPALQVTGFAVAGAGPLGGLPSVLELAGSGEHRVRRDEHGTLWAARLSETVIDTGAVRRPRRGETSRWHALVRVRSQQPCDIDVVWRDPDFGPRSIGVRELPADYPAVQALPDTLWAAHLARQLVSHAGLRAGDHIEVTGPEPRAALLRAAITTPDASPVPSVRTRRVRIALDGESGANGPVIVTSPAEAPDDTTTSPVSWAGAATWPRSVPYRTTATPDEARLLPLAGRQVRPASQPRDTTATAARRRTAVVIGGRGGLGRELAADLARRSFSRIIVVGTRPESEQDRSTTAFEYLRCDLADPSSITTLVDRLAEADAEDCYLFHLAGRLSAGPLAELGHEEWARVLAPKVDGTRHLLEVARRCHARLLVAYSSASAVLPSPQFAHYGAANAAMEGMLAAAHDVRSPGVRWGFWAGAGMLRDLDATREFAPEGVGEIGVEDGLDFLWRALDEPHEDLPVCYPADWARFVSRYPSLARDALLRELHAHSPKPLTTREEIPVPATGHRSSALESLIMETLKITDVSVVRTATRLRSIGLDSLLAVELRAKIKSSFGRAVPIRTLLGPIDAGQLEAVVTDPSAG